MYNIGLVVGNVEDPFSNQVCKGAMKAAHEVGDNLFIVPAKYLNHLEEPDLNLPHRYEYQYNFLMAYAKSQSLDMVLLCLSTIGHKCSTKYYEKVLKGFDCIPVFMLASDEEGYSSVMYDNETGIREAIRYLIDEKGCKNIGMVCGNEENVESQIRFRVYQEELQKSNLPIIEKRIVHGDFSEYCLDVMEELVKNNPDLDAIVCGNDSMAKGLYPILNKYGREIGKDIYVTGFDDLDFAHRLNPPLATVRADASEMGYRACKDAHESLKEFHEKKLDKIPIRRSRVNTSFVCRESASGRKKEAEVFTEDIMKEYENRIQRLIAANHRLNIITRDMLMVGNGSENNFTNFLNALNLEGNTCSYLFMLDKPIEYHYREDFDIVDKLYLQAFKMRNKVVEYTKNEKKLTLHEIFDQKWYDNKPKCYVLIDIYSREKQYGLLLCDMEYEYLLAVENLCYQISMATKIIYLLQVQESLIKEKQLMVQHLEQENLILDNISNTDELTGINNRRGFITEVLAVLNDKTNIGKRAVMIYTDLNYLKLINDRYSHGEGNYALQSCAAVLDNVWEEEGIAGRLGGDEFALFTIIDWPNEGQKIKKRILEQMEHFNKTNNKPYEISMSVGVYEFDISMNCDLKQILDCADEKVYEDKAHKKPFVEYK